jgi:hypothetical protein
VTTSTTNVFNFSSGPPAGTALLNGALGTPGTTVLFGGNEVGTAARSGLRGTVGYWFSDCHLLGIEASGFFLGQDSKTFHDQSLGERLIGRPFFDPTLPAQNVEAVAGLVNQTNFAPFVLAGSVDVKNTSSFWGYETNLRCNLCCGPHFYVDGLLGYRQLALDETLTVVERGTDASPVVFTGGATPVVVFPQGTTFVLHDRFSAQNRFYGAQAGLDAEFLSGRWSVGLKTKVGLGTTQQVADVSGGTAFTVPPGSPVTPAGTSVLPVGLLAQATNSGRHTRDRFTVVPEVGLNLGYQFCDHLRATVGYNFLYWSDVARPGNLIDLGVARLGPPPPRPAFNFNGSDFWAQGLTFGLEFRY